MASPIWKVIGKNKKIVIKGACYLVGDGASVNIWMDPWVPWIQNFRPRPRVQSFTQLPIMAYQLIKYERHAWKEPMIKELFDLADVLAILCIPLPMRHSEDKLIWVPNFKRVFIVKSAYHYITNQYFPDPPSNPWKMIRNLNAPEHLKMFLWRIGVNVLPNRENLMKRFDEARFLLCSLW